METECLFFSFSGQKVDMLHRVPLILAKLDFRISCDNLNFLKNLPYFANTSRIVELIVSKCGQYYLWTLMTKSYKVFIILHIVLHLKANVFLACIYKEAIIYHVQSSPVPRMSKCQVLYRHNVGVAQVAEKQWRWVKITRAFHKNINLSLWKNE